MCVFAVKERQSKTYKYESDEALGYLGADRGYRGPL